MELNVAKEVARLQKMTCGELRDEFASQTGETTNAKNRKWLIRRIIWRMQANAEGGLSEPSHSQSHPRTGRRSRLRVTSPASRQLPERSRKTYEEGCRPVRISNATLLPGTLAHTDLQGPSKSAFA